jgi:hypothetical protein
VSVMGEDLRGNQIYGAFVLNRRVDLHAIDATPARWRGDVASSPLDGASAATSLVDVHTGDDGRLFNPASSKQIQTLLFGGSANQKTGEILEREREFDVDLPASELPVVDEERDEEVLVTKEEFYAKVRDAA